MSAQAEQERARQAYAAGRPQRESEDVQMGRDNARIDGAATGAQGGGAR
ncbi:hypothetical protein OOK58_42155 [Streptomyces sp. NBC_01728]|nr:MULTISPECIES: hypothetical protein [unclassified Streptomyces]MCX4458519.1 hypothetical protein [Streptomyces sp. NBC_01719]MCX4497876.1 hypothetical protein [Streptomyces sp. NBC_01728]